MNSYKIEKMVKQTQEKTNKNIKKLFERLRNESNQSLNNTNDSVILIENETPFNEKDKLTIESLEPDIKKKCCRDSLIIIKDDDFNTSTICSMSRTSMKSPNSSPVHCSTPLSNKSRKSHKNRNKPISNIQLDAKCSKKLSLSKENANNNCIEDNLNNSNTTKVINKDSFLTIDLTTETGNSALHNTVIDLANNTTSTSDSQDCMFVSCNSSMSGDSNVTVLQKPNRKRKNEKQIQNFANGISKLNPTEKGRLLELITQNIFNGCNVPQSVKDNLKESRATETVESTYIKEVILGEKHSRNSIGSNIYNPQKDVKNKTGLRMIVIDGSNVAMEHTAGRQFSVEGLQICINYFLNRGHTVKAFVPRFRCKFGKSSNPRLLDDLERRGLVVYTPSREIQGRFVTSYDDRYIVQCAAEFDGVIVSGDNYRDLLRENPRWRFTIENRLLPFTWVDNMIMFPRDPLGRKGPTLENFLRHNPQNANDEQTSIFSLKNCL